MEESTPMPRAHITTHPTEVKSYMEKGLKEPDARDEVAKNLRFKRVNRDLLNQKTENEFLQVTNESLQKVALRDPLTGLYNRRFIDGEPTHNPPLAGELQILEKEAERTGRPLSAAMIDIDFFKRVNDEFTHKADDLVLKEVAKIILGKLRASDRVIRYGGEEILVLFPDTSLEDAVTAVEKIREAMALTKFDGLNGNGKMPKQITISAGVALYEKADQYIEEALPWLEVADRALYEAKEAGRNRTYKAEYIGRTVVPNYFPVKQE